MFAHTENGQSSDGGWFRGVRQVLQHWKQQGHKALFFTQTQQMLDIVERAVQAAGFRCSAAVVCRVHIAS